MTAPDIDIDNGPPKLRKSIGNKYLSRSDPLLGGGSNQVFAFIARQYGTVNTAVDLFGIARKACDPNLSRTPLDERKHHHGLFLLQTKLSCSCVIGV